MELLLKLAALCAIAAILALLLREEKQLLSILVILALVLAAVPLLLRGFGEIFTFFNTLISLSALPERVFSPMLKVVGIAIVTKIGTSVCKEADSDTAAALLEMGGTCCALLASVPLMTMALDLLRQML